MHGRKAFEGHERIMSGCYIDRTELASKARTVGLSLWNTPEEGRIGFKEWNENIKLELAQQSFKLNDLIHKFQSVNNKRFIDLINKLIDDDVLSIDLEKNIYLK